MGTSLSGLTPATTFDGLLKVGDNDPLTADLKAISTGDGTDTILQLSNSALSIGGETTIVSDNIGSDSPFLINTSSSKLLKIINLNSATTPILGISHGSQDTRLSMWTTMGFRVQGVGIAEMTSSEVRVGGGSGARLAVKGSGATSATTSLLVQNSAGTDLFKVEDGGTVRTNSIRGLTYPNTHLSLGFNASFLNFNSLTAPKLAVNTSVPSGTQAIIKGSGNDNTTNALLIQNSASTPLDLFKVLDNGTLVAPNLPTSATGLPTGAIWNDGGTLKIA